MQSMNYIASQYQTRVTDILLPASVSTQVLPADYRRFFVRIEWFVSGAGPLFVFPGNQTLTPIGVEKQVQPIEYKFRDCPSITTGEFTGFSSIPVTIRITECLFVGS